MVHLRCILLLFLAYAPWASALDKLENVPLLWKPTSSLADWGPLDLADIENADIRFQKFKDLREDPRLIGENREHSRAWPVTTTDDVGGYVTKHLTEAFDKAGLDVVDSGGHFLVGGEVRDFLVIEDDTYVAEVTLRVMVRNPAGKILWTGVSGGSAKRFGRSFTIENYYEVLSDSLLQAAYNLLANPGFQAALQHDHKKL